MISPLKREAKSTASYLQSLAEGLFKILRFPVSLTLDLPVPVAPTTAMRGSMVNGRLMRQKERRKVSMGELWSFRIHFTLGYKVQSKCFSL
jgi:hypothetical protein